MIEYGYKVMHIRKKMYDDYIDTQCGLGIEITKSKNRPIWATVAYKKVTCGDCLCMEMSNLEQRKSNVMKQLHNLAFQGKVDINSILSSMKSVLG